jgi:23S rRNA (guanosine2251-2'-O)-methyltransferase
VLFVNIFTDHLITLRVIVSQNMKTHIDSDEYLEKKLFFKQLLTVYGRKPVVEALQQTDLPCFRLHLAESNKPSSIITEIEQLAKKRDIEIHYHDRQALSRISKNGKQDQGVCLDISCPSHQDFKSFLKNRENNRDNKPIRLLALDRITNPQNLGMIIRSSCAGNIDGLLLSEKGCAKLDALVTKASTGTVFRAPILHCESLSKALKQCRQEGAVVVGLSSHAEQTLQQFIESDFVIYVLGNESAGMSTEIESLCHQKIKIPMNNDVESLNVAVTSSLLAFRHML